MGSDEWWSACLWLHNTKGEKRRKIKEGERSEKRKKREEKEDREGGEEGGNIPDPYALQVDHDLVDVVAILST